MFRIARLLCLSLLLTLPAFGEELPGRPVDESVTEDSTIRFKVELEGAKDNVKMAQLSDGSLVYIVKRTGAGQDRMLTPQEFAQFYYDQRTHSHGGFLDFLQFIFNTTSLTGIIWVSIGLLGQAIFMGRMLVQWFISEKSKKSIIPVSFWWMSLIGSTMSLVYFLWRRDIVGILANGTGWVIYIRNLMLISAANRAAAKQA